MYILPNLRKTFLKRGFENFLKDYFGNFLDNTKPF